MKSMIQKTALAALAMCTVALVGCNAVEDVRDAPFTPVPAEGVVLQGKVTGTLGNKRSLTLMNNGNADGAISVLYTLGQPYTVFNFGVVPVGSAYNVQVRTNPFGKVCTVTGGQGTVTTAAALNITVNCVNDPNVNRYNLKVTIPSDFGGRAGAKVTLTTEEGVFDIVPANGATSVTFSNSLFNNFSGGVVWGANTTTSTSPTSSAGGGINPITNLAGATANGPTFTWAVTATTTEGSTDTRPQVNRCAVAYGSNFLATASGGVAGAVPAGGLAANTALPPITHIGFNTTGTVIPTAAGVAVAGVPAGPTQNPTVGACTFSIGGTVAYSTPPTVSSAGVITAGTTPQVMSTSTPLKLELRDVQGNVIETLTHTAGYATSGTTAGGAGAPYKFSTVGRSTAGSVYDIVVSQHPQGHYCVVANGGAATLGVATANITNTNVFCRAVPASANRLKGTYGFFDGVTYNYPQPTSAIVVGPGANTGTLVVSIDGTLTTTTVHTTTYNTRTTYLSTTNPGLGGESKGQNIQRIQKIRTFINVKTPTAPMTTTSDTTVDNVVTDTTNARITRNFLTFFTDGTFLYGAHGPGQDDLFATATNQIEHGFYTWSPTGGAGGTGLLTFTLTSDTITGTGGNTALLNVGLSGTPGVTTVTGSPHAVWNRVVKNTVNGRAALSAEATLTGNICPAAGGGVPAGAVLPCFVGSTTLGSKWQTMRWIEPKNTDDQLEGPWVSQDHRRLWNYDNNTTLGIHVGVNGGASNMQDGCFTFQDFRAVSGSYTRRGGITGCLDALTFPAGIGTIDIPSTTVGTPSTLNSLPGFVGRMPGSETAFDGRSPSPIYYALGTAATVGAIADDTFFPPAETTPAALAWCTTDVFMVRSSLNGDAINKPAYFCRERTN